MEFNKALESVSSRGIIYRAQAREDQNREVPVSYTLGSLDLDSVRLVYFLPATVSEKIIPIYVFEGIGIDSESGKEVRVVVLLSAY